MTSICVEQLIKSVSKYPLIYDFSHEDYKDMKKRYETWDKIGLELKQTGDQSKKRWKNIRDTYAKYLHRRLKPNPQMQKRNYKDWRWAKQMEIFRPYMPIVNTELNLDTNLEEGEIVQTQSDKINPPDIPEMESVFLQSQRPRILTVDCSNMTPSTSKCKESFLVHKAATPFDSIFDYLKNKRRSDVDATDLIFMGYAKTVKSFPVKVQTMVKLKFARIIMQAELDNEPKTSPASRPSPILNTILSTSTCVDLDNIRVSANCKGPKEMICRLCLRSAPAESLISIQENDDLLVQNIWSCCRIKVRQNDGLPDTICSSCESNLKSLVNFKNTCIQSGQVVRPKLNFLPIKPEEVILDDLNWTNVAEDNESCDDNPLEVVKKVSPSHGTEILNTVSESVSKINSKLMCECGKLCHDASELELHRFEHIFTKNKPSTSKVCRSSFDQRPALGRRRKKSLKCNIRPKLSVEKCKLTMNAKAHLPKQPFECDFCSKTFIFKSSIVQHMKFHYESRESSSSRSSFGENEKHHVKDKLYKLFTCDFCSKSFAFKTCLIMHMNSHKINF